ncbi:glycoside hydrolase family 2 protein [Rhizobiaceae bacterium n13]|uniref:beta-mannosidase n=1 Tax=Ferirhizobium litorale TaxID=2927786 RepID=A0AAE3QBK0_9HYPH|nr:glycoside hydrolase family 2 protein [Fererhizobium litorale]MDI7861817.1 glycoside hydrolase family 2 protein [Fererhizobium litorale]MDI7921841.1 glycoside hydrolase family 2 protein [Fererhizobium litorale]
MTGRLSLIGAEVKSLTDGWRLALTAAGACLGPFDVSTGDAIAAPVPGTVAAALERAGRFDRGSPVPLDTQDAWYFLDLADELPGPATLRFEGLATTAEVYLNDQLILSSQSMFEAYDVAIDLSGRDTLAICFRALAPHLAKAGPRARWRPQMMNSQGLRLVRTTALGYMPGWCPEIHAVGPWRPVSLIRPGAVRIRDLSLSTELTAEGEGILRLSFTQEGEAVRFRLACSGSESEAERGGDGCYSGTLRLSDVEPWWPHTHGVPHLYEVSLLVDGVSHSLGRTGFRRIDIDRGTHGNDFAVLVNGEKVFCRGAVWTNADIVGLPGRRADYEPWLKLAVEAGMNMIRIGGTMTYETPEFFALCDELGLMVWQDFMFANFDYPAKDEAFLAHVRAEIDNLLSAIQLSPSLSILCGGSEIYQQAAMMGLPERIWSGPLTEEILPELVARRRPGVPYVANSPIGGAMPFAPNAGVTHYYGVGAYCQPLDDARRAEVRFAAECLAFSHVPQQSTLERHLPMPSVHDPRWKARVPRDRGASWDFEDIRDHYLRELYGFDPPRLRREQPQRYLNLSRAATGEVIEEVFAEWRRSGSTCNGALVWTLQDLLPGAGWGVIDATGNPKPVWFALKRAFRSVQVVFTDEGTNGLDVHVVNETARALDVDLEVVCLRAGQQAVVSGRRELLLEPGTSERLPVTQLFGAFFDTNYAFRFGPPSHDVVVARLCHRETGASLAEAFHFPLGRTAAFHDATLEVQLVSDNNAWAIELSTDRLAQSVHIDVEGYRPSDDWFHLAPATTRRILLHPRADTPSGRRPEGEIVAASANHAFRF